jgi:hypothetical protein
MRAPAFCTCFAAFALTIRRSPSATVSFAMRAIRVSSTCGTHMRWDFSIFVCTSDLVCIHPIRAAAKSHPRAHSFVSLGAPPPCRRSATVCGYNADRTGLRVRDLDGISNSINNSGANALTSELRAQCVVLACGFSARAHDLAAFLQPPAAAVASTTTSPTTETASAVSGTSATSSTSSATAASPPASAAAAAAAAPALYLGTISVAEPRLCLVGAIHGRGAFSNPHTMRVQTELVVNHLAAPSLCARSVGAMQQWIRQLPQSSGGGGGEFIGACLVDTHIFVL